jgi:hypothetical protein
VDLTRMCSKVNSRTEMTQSITKHEMPLLNNICCAKGLAATEDLAIIRSCELFRTGPALLPLMCEYLARQHEISPGSTGALWKAYICSGLGPSLPPSTTNTCNWGVYNFLQDLSTLRALRNPMKSVPLCLREEPKRQQFKVRCTCR